MPLRQTAERNEALRQRNALGGVRKRGQGLPVDVSVRKSDQASVFAAVVPLQEFFPERARLNDVQYGSHTLSLDLALRVVRLVVFIVIVVDSAEEGCRRQLAVVSGNDRLRSPGEAAYRLGGRNLRRLVEDNHVEQVIRLPAAVRNPGEGAVGGNLASSSP